MRNLLFIVAIFLLLTGCKSETEKSEKVNEENQEVVYDVVIAPQKTNDKQIFQENNIFVDPEERMGGPTMTLQEHEDE